MRLIWVRTKAEYFSIPGLTQFLKIRSDLPVVPSRRTRLRLRAKQISSQSVGWAKRKRAHHHDACSVMDGGHGANAPLPTLRLPPHRHCERSEAIHGAACGEMDCFVASLPCANASRLSQARTMQNYHASMHGRFFVARASGFGTERKPAVIHCRVSAGSITSSISSTEAIETALPLA
jgi:hypothetical protein